MSINQSGEIERGSMLPRNASGRGRKRYNASQK
jgi:hypothetical protein